MLDSILSMKLQFEYLQLETKKHMQQLQHITNVCFAPS